MAGGGEPKLRHRPCTEPPNASRDIGRPAGRIANDKSATFAYRPQTMLTVLTQGHMFVLVIRIKTTDLYAHLQSKRVEPT